jgi:hypothetical protein
MNNETVTIVSGLPRSGTSMMMVMLEAGGLEVLTDGERKADEDNPKGYYEFEKVKKLKDDSSWVPQAKAKVVKIVSALLQHLPPEYSYKVIFMLRDMEETVASQKQMLVRRNEPTDRISDQDLETISRNHLQEIDKWLAEQLNFEVLYVNYNEVLNNPIRHSQEIRTFLGGSLDVAEMARVVDSNLYRQRRHRR